MWMCPICVHPSDFAGGLGPPLAGPVPGLLESKVPQGLPGSLPDSGRRSGHETCGPQAPELAQLCAGCRIGAFTLGPPRSIADVARQRDFDCNCRTGPKPVRAPCAKRFGTATRVRNHLKEDVHFDAVPNFPLLSVYEPVPQSSCATGACAPPFRGVQGTFRLDDFPGRAAFESSTHGALSPGRVPIRFCQSECVSCGRRLRAGPARTRPAAWKNHHSLFSRPSPTTHSSTTCRLLQGGGPARSRPEMKGLRRCSG